MVIDRPCLHKGARRGGQSSRLLFIVQAVTHSPLDQRVDANYAVRLSGLVLDETEPDQITDRVDNVTEVVERGIVIQELFGGRRSEHRDGNAVRIEPGRQREQTARKMPRNKGI